MNPNKKYYQYSKLNNSSRKERSQAIISLTHWATEHLFSQAEEQNLRVLGNRISVFFPILSTVSVMRVL